MSDQKKFIHQFIIVADLHRYTSAWFPFDQLCIFCSHLRVLYTHMQYSKAKWPNRVLATLNANCVTVLTPDLTLQMINKLIYLMSLSTT